MMSINDKFIENEKALERNFNFEKLNRQLVYLSKYQNELVIKPSDSTSRKAAIIKDKICLNGYIDSRFENTLLYSQAREVINQYLSS